MGVSITTDVFCDGCGMWLHFTTGRGAQIAAAKKAAKAAGWTVKGPDCFCPKCNGSNPDYWGFLGPVKCGGILPAVYK